MRKMARILFILIILVFLTSCSPAQTITVVTSTPAPVISSASLATETADNENITLTPEQSKKIYALLSGVMYISDLDHANSILNNTSKQPTESFLGYAYIIINNYYGFMDREYIETDSVNSNEVIDIIHSAFGVDYSPQEGDCYGELLVYDGNRFVYEGSDPALTDALPYRIERMPSGSFQVKFNMTYDYIPGTEYIGKGEAVLKEDKDSIFGFRLMSMSKSEDADIVFTGAEASSCIDGDSKTYGAENAIDGDDNTAWVSGGEDEWIKLSFDEPQRVSGLLLHFGNWSSDKAFDEGCIPSSCLIEFSDGTSVIDEYCQTYKTGDDTCFFFDEVKNTSYIKVTITSVAEGTGTDMVVYVSEIKPI